MSFKAVARDNKQGSANLAPVAFPQIIGSSSSSNAQLDEFQVHLWTAKVSVNASRDSTTHCLPRPIHMHT